ncbi:MAG: hypothetical protein AAFY99_01115 [Pseudomonadota bacterium]
MFFWLEGAIYTGTIPAIAIGFLSLETLFLLWLYRRHKIALMIITNAVAGGAVMVGIYLMATGGSALVVAALLVASLVAHLFDLKARHRLIEAAEHRDSSSTHAS